MSFGRNPHVTKAQAAEQKARTAKDDTARELAWREAARLWDRAADRENNDKRRQEYLSFAEAARAIADTRGHGDGRDDAFDWNDHDTADIVDTVDIPAPTGDLRTLN